MKLSNSNQIENQMMNENSKHYDYYFVKCLL